MPEIKKEIKIKNKDGWDFIHHNLFFTEGIWCPTCTFNYIDGAYVHIICKLKNSGLLDKNYPLQCCDCYPGDK